MRIIATSDLHGFLPDIPPCDVLILAGDITPIAFDRDVYRVANWCQDVLKPWLEDIHADETIAIAGNHDFYFEDFPIEARDLPWTYLLDDEIVIDGVKFYGTPWVPNLFGWAFYSKDHDLERVYDAIPNGTDIVISHGPPWLLVDGDTGFGTPYANDMLDRIEPPVFICGHIHEGYGHDDVNSTNLYNVSYCDIHYRPVNLPYFIEYPANNDV